MNVQKFQTPRSECRNSRSRSGVTLLFVISIIVLFLLMGTTFVVVSNDYLRAAKRRSVSGGVNAGAVTRQEGQQLVVQSFLNAVRGPSLDDINNPLRGHDLLGDMYGFGIEAEIDNAIAYQGSTNTPFIKLNLSANPSDTVSLLTGEQESLEDIPGHYAGQVLTITSGDFDGLTARIIQHVPASIINGSTEHELIVHPLGGTHDVSGALDGMDDAKIIINGKAFAGTGAGGFDENVLVDAAALDGEAIRPDRTGNERDELYEDYLVRTTTGGTTEPNPQSTNEPWDAFDFQNMALASVRDASNFGVLDADEIQPSFGGNRNGSSEYSGFKAFSGGGPRQVDNDNDGKDDGIWIDTDLPVRSTPDGEYIKPLVSYLILDMGGRLNISAHGNLSELDTTVNLDLTRLFGAVPGPVDANFPRGMGFGPAEVALSAVMPPQMVGGTDINIAQRILNARYSNAAGSEELPGIPNSIDRKASYAFTGYPFGDTGNHFGSPFDLYGRTSFGFWNNGGTELDAFMPDVLTFDGTPTPPVNTQLTDSPYEIELLSTSNVNDVTFVPADLERMLRPGDRDSILLSTRLDGDDDDVGNVNNDTNSRLAPLFSDMNTTTNSDDQRDFFRKLLTTHSFEVPSIPVDINRRLYDALGGGLTEPAKAALMGLLLSPEVRRGLPMDINRIFGDGVDNDGDGIVDEFDELEEGVDGIGADVILDVDNDGRPIDNSTGDVAFSGLVARNNFARRLFVLMVLLTEYEDRDGDGTITVADDFFDFDGSGTTNADDWLAHRRILAQWCANVVDFRDPDSIMTGIEFDLNPFDGWGVNGNVRTFDDDNDDTTPYIDGQETLANFPGASAGQSSYFVAWGMERPELLISETSALHDRRSQDLDSEDPSGATTTDSPSDTDFDSLYVPVASAFFELYNPWLSRLNSTPVELSTTPDDDDLGNGVDLALTAPADGGITAPVWRMVIVNPGGLTTGGSPELARYLTDFEFQVDTQLDNLSTGSGINNAIARIVYFTDPIPGTAPGDGQFDSQRVYFAGSGVNLPSSVLEPGKFAVIGSGGSEKAVGGSTSYVTYFGRRDNDAVKAPNDPALELDQTQRIELTAGTGTVMVAGATRTEAIVIPINTVANDGTGSKSPRSFGVSDPIGGYDTGGRIVSPVLDMNGDPADGMFFVDAAGMPLTIDEPIDMTVAGLDPTLPDWADSPINRNGLTTGFRVALLQRLADPTQPYNQIANPYRTIDSSSVDLFAFNGLADDSAFVNNSAVPDGGTGNRVIRNAFGTFERGQTRTVPENGQGLLWQTSVVGETDARASTTAAPGQIPVPALPAHVHDQPYINSLGAMNDFYLDNLSGGQPFASLIWNNRPYANQYELANVPYTSPGWFTRLFNVPVDTLTEKPYEANSHVGTGGTTPDSGTLFRRYRLEPNFTTTIVDELHKTIHPNAFGFTHLLNFAAEDGTGGPESDRLHAVMDFLEVPSRFAGTREYVRTDDGSGGLLTQLTDDTALGDFGYRLSAPFDELNTYRYPGKVNLNTISSPLIWNALLGSRDPATPGPYATAFDFTAWSGSLDGNPFRPATASNYVSGGMVPGTANAGLYRSANADRTNGTAADVGSDFEPATQYAAFNTDRNASFRNGLRQRLGGVATNRSSVFAIWVTVGYFEWDIENNVLRNSGSGGIEYGTDTGTAQRSRGFFLFDRSIPMAYEPGEDHNIDRGILLQSLIE